MAKTVKYHKTPDLSQRITPELLGESIRAKRSQSKLKLSDAAALCGVAKQTLANIEAGHSTTQINTILQVCANLGIVSYIKRWHEDNENE